MVQATIINGREVVRTIGEDTEAGHSTGGARQI